MKARFYDSNVGRFISEDPKGFDGGDTNLMSYTSNNPINFSDPLGTDKVTTVLGVASMITGTASLIPGVDAVAIPATAGLLLINATYTAIQSYKNGGVNLSSGKDLALMAADTAVLVAAKSYPLTSVLVGTGLVRPLDVINTTYDGVTSFSPKTCGH